MTEKLKEAWARFLLFLTALIPWAALNALAQWIGRLLAPVGRLLLWLLRPVGRVIAWIARKTGLDKLFPWRYLLLVGKPYWVGPDRFQGWALAIVTLTLMVLNARALLFMGQQFGHMMDVIKDKQDDQFYLAVQWLVISSLLWALCGVMYGYIRSWWGSHWRVWMNQMYLRQFTVNEAYLRMQSEHPEIDNVDQRLAQDPDPTANTIVWLANVLPEAIVNIVTFSPLLFAESPWLFFACLGCAMVAWVVTFVVGRRLPKLTYELQKSEADLRTHLQGVIAQARAVALQMSDRLVAKESTKRLAYIYHNLREIQKVNRNVSFFTTIWGKIIEYGPQVFIGWLFMQGRTSFGKIAQGALAFGQVYGGLSILSSQFGAFSTLKAELERLGPLADALDAIGENRMPVGDWIEYSIGDGLVFDDVTVYSTYLEGKPVVRNLKLNATDNIMFTSRDGQGKARLADAIAFGCARGKGKIKRPASCDIIGVTLPAYLQPSTLREFLSDKCGVEPTDEALLAALKEAGLGDLPGRTIDGADKQLGPIGLDTVVNWKTKLSAPDQLLLCLARIILAMPKLVVVDQATAGLEPEVQAFFFKALRLKKLHFVTLSNDATLAPHHDRVIELDDNGDSKEFPADQYKQSGWKPALRSFLGLH